MEVDSSFSLGFEAMSSTAQFEQISQMNIKMLTKNTHTHTKKREELKARGKKNVQHPLAASFEKENHV